VHQLWFGGSTVSSPSGVRGKASTSTWQFITFYRLTKPMVSILLILFLANVNSRSRSLPVYAVARPSVVWSVTLVRPIRRLKFSAIFLRHWYLGHPLTSTENLTEIVPGEPLRRGVKHKRGSKI